MFLFPCMFRHLTSYLLVPSYLVWRRAESGSAGRLGSGGPAAEPAAQPAAAAAARPAAVTSSSLTAEDPCSTKGQVEERVPYIDP